MGTKGTLLSIIVLSVYLISTMGFGRYSCHCDHSSSISFLGITTECSCTKSEHHKEHNHHCNCCPCCGRHLTTQEISRKDCCSVKYFYLDTDQTSQSLHISSYVVDVQPAIIPVVIIQPLQLILITRIKTFQALFHRTWGSVFERFLQLKI